MNFQKFYMQELEAMLKYWKCDAGGQTASAVALK
jgi:hypothetical protein